MKTTMILVFIALISVASAFHPLSFANGFNNAMGLQADKKVDQCIYTFLMSDQARHDFLKPSVNNNMDIVCLEVFETYRDTLNQFASKANQEVGWELNALLALSSTLETVKNLKRNSNYEAGETLAKALKNMAISTSQAQHARLAEVNGSVNWTSVLIGLNDQLLVTSGPLFGSCLGDSNQVEIIIKAIIIAVNHKDVIHSIEDIVKLVQHLPVTKLDCKDTVANYGKFIKTIVQAYDKDQAAFFGTIESNIEKQPLKVTEALRGFFKGLKNNQDYSAGRSLGQLIQLLLKGIIN